MGFDVYQIRKDFPILDVQVNGKPLVYFDNSATTHKPVQVIDRISQYYKNENSNVHRGVHLLSQVATEKFENARKYVAQFINAPDPSGIIFTKGTTESVNLIATVFDDFIQPGDEIMKTAMEHHSNLVPWQQLCRKKKARLIVVPVRENGELDLDAFTQMIHPGIKMFAVAHVSNVLGTVNPIKKLVKMAHQYQIPVFVDGAQAIAHARVDVQDIDCDFYAFSGHKAYGPMGIGVLYGKTEWLEKLPPYQFGGEMIESVKFDSVVYNKLPYKFEAGTPNVAGAVGMEAALRYIEHAGIDNIRIAEDELLEYATGKLIELEGIKIIGNAPGKASILSFVVEGVHPYDLGTLLDQMGVAVRTGFHCAQPLVESFGLTGTVRASFAMYNTFEEIDIFNHAVKKSVEMLR